MKSRAIVFEEAGKACLRELDVPELGAREVLAQTLISGVSVGTERWAYLGKRPEIRFPNVPGYMGIAQVTQVGAEARARGYKEGHVINFNRARMPEPYRSHSWMSSHVSHAVVDVCVPEWDPRGFNLMQAERVPEGLDPMQASLTQLAAVALRGIDMATIPAGATVLVCGLGVIGLYAIQICRLKGARVAATDVVPGRLEIARKYGAEWVIDGKVGDLTARSAEISPGGYDIIIDTSSIPEVVNRLFPLLKLWGSFVFQGWYPPPSSFDLNVLHQRLPTCYFPCAHTGRATAAAMQWAVDGKLDTQSMITHVCRPEEAAKIYGMLSKGAEESLGVVFDWRNA
jgi:3-hydroxyethyl bacteriochlorophyllide a dehydrogenase